MKRFLTLFCLLPFLASASIIQYSWTNWDGTISTNDLIITYTKQANSGDGRTAIKGLPTRYPTVNGFLQTTNLVGFYTVIPYDMEDLVQPILFEVPNDANTYNFWQLRRSFGNYFDVTGVLGLTAGQGVSLSPTNGTGFVTINFGGTNGAVYVFASSNNVVVTTNAQGNIFGVGLQFLPMIASLVLSNYSTVGTNYWYPTNNPQGFISASQVPGLLGYQTNAITTNTPTGMTNVVKSIAGTSGSLAGLSDVHLGGLGAGQALRYNSLSGQWTNDVQGSVTSVSASVPTEFSVGGVPITSAGTIAISKVNQTANTVWAGPTSGGMAQPVFRALVAADIPAIAVTSYASNILSGGNIAQSALASNSPANGWHLVNSNGFNFWTANGSALTNLQGPNVVGLIPVASIGTGNGSAGTFLRGDRVWTSQLLGTLSVFGQINNTGNLLLDNGAIVSDGNGSVLGLKWIGQHWGSAIGLTNVSATNLIDTVASARLSNNIPRLEAANVFANNNEFQLGLLNDGGFTNLASAVITPTLLVGVNGVIGASNRFQVVNVAGRNLLQVNTNGALWVGTNNQLYIDPSGGVQSAGTSNHFNGKIVEDVSITSAQLLSDNIQGSAVYDKLHGTQAADLQARLLFDGNSTSSLDWTNRQLLNSFNFASVDWQALKMNDSNGTKSEDWGVRGLYDHLGALQLSWFNGPVVGSGANLTALNASQLTSGTVPTAAFPVLGTVYPAALTNNEARSPLNISSAQINVTATSNWFSGTLHAAQGSFDALTNNAATLSTIGLYDAGKKLGSLANGGANVLIHGTTPPAYSAVVEADQSLSDVVTANSSTVQHGYLKKLDNVATHYMDGTGSWSTPAGNGSATGAWNTNGNTGLGSDGSYFVGNIDAKPLFFKVNNVTVGWLSPGSHPDIVFGGGLTFTTNTIEQGGSAGGGNIIAGGIQNDLASSSQCAIVGGAQLSVQTNNSYAGLFAGSTSIIRSNSGGSVIIGGNANDLGIGPSASCLEAAIVGGIFNTNTGSYSFVAGGGNNAILAGAQLSFVAGHRAKATHSGTFVFGDSQDTVDFTDAGQDTFNIRATNGIRAKSVFYMTNTTLIAPDLFVTNVAGANQWMKLQNGNLSVGGTISGTLSGILPSSISIPYSTNIASHFADSGNSTTADTTLYSDSIPGNTLSANGMKLEATYGLNTVLHATATRQMKVFFGGTSIIDSGALVYSANGNVDIRVFIIRDSSTSIRYKCNLTSTGSNPTNFVTVGKLTGLTLSAANTLELHGQAGAAGALSNDIVATEGNVDWKP